MKQSAERRVDVRTASNERLFAQITASEEEQLVGVTFSCYALDVSAGGLRIVSDSPIPKGSKLDLWVDTNRRPGKYFLTSDVRWSESSAGGECYVGVELQESPTTDIEQWRQDH